MNPRLLRSCLALWIFGLLGMWLLRVVFALEPGTLAFQAAAGLWILGGLGYTAFGVLGLAACEREERERSDSAAKVTVDARERTV